MVHIYIMLRSSQLEPCGCAELAIFATCKEVITTHRKCRCWLTVSGNLFASAEYSLSNELAELHHAGSLQGEDPNSADKMGASRCTLKPFQYLQTLHHDMAVQLVHTWLSQDWP